MCYPFERYYDLLVSYSSTHAVCILENFASTYFSFYLSCVVAYQGRSYHIQKAHLRTHWNQKYGILKVSL